jgi:hypothetical protein
MGIQQNRRGGAAAGIVRKGLRSEIDTRVAVPLNSAANPLPTTLCGRKIPLSTGPANQPEATDLSRVFDDDRAHFAG